MTIEFNGNTCGCCPWRNLSRGIIERRKILRAHASAWLAEVSRESVIRGIISEVPVEVQDKIDAIVRYVQQEQAAIEVHC